MANGDGVQVHLRVDFAGDASVGPGKIALLEKIDSAGSLSQAARDLALSYRRAWILLDDLNQAFGEPVVVTATGGARGGGATLTPLGRQLIDRYRAAERAAERMVTAEFRGIASKVKAARPRGRALRRPVSRQL